MPLSQPRKVRLIVLAYLVPFLCVGIALWSFDQQRDARRASAAVVFSETRQAVLVNCQQIETVKTQLRNTLIEAKADAKQNLKRFRGEKSLYPILKAQLEKSLIKQDVVIKRFSPINCNELPFINRGKNPYP